MSGQLKWNYLGCYVKNGPKPVVANAPSYGSKNQGSCLREARNSKVFALQTGRGDNCFIGDKVNGTKVPASQCNQVCNAGRDQLLRREKQAGCGAAEAGPNKPFSVYGVTRSIMPKNIRMDRKNLVIDGSSSSENYKNGRYSFYDSSHAFHWSAKRAFDDIKATFWMTPFQYVGRWRWRYNMRRSRNYTDHNYKQVDPKKGGPGLYNQKQKPYNRRLMDNPREPYIVIGTKEAKIDPTDKTDAIIHYGEWCQINYPFQMFLTEYSIHPAQLNPRDPREEIATFPKHYVVMGSNDGEEWVSLDSENLNKYTKKLLMERGGISGNSMDNFIKSTPGNKLGGATKQVIVNKPYSMYRLIVKENYGSTKVALSKLIFRGKICKNLGGDCTINTAEPESFINMNTSNNLDQPEGFDGFEDFEGFEGFEDINQSSNIDANIEDESFANMYNNETSQHEGFEDLNQSSNIDAIIENESFTNMYNNEMSQPLNELNVFQSDYSKFN